MDEHFYEYRTGHTRPTKSRNGPVAFLLICVIFLCGIVSLLSMANIRLSHLLQQTDATSPVSFSGEDTLPAASDVLCLYVEGMTLQELPSLYQKLYDLPQGLYITQVSAGSNAKTLGIAPGNVLIAVNGVAVSQLDALQTLLNTLDGTLLEVTVYQNGTERTITLND